MYNHYHTYNVVYNERCVNFENFNFYLFGKLFLAQLVEGVKLASQDVVLKEPARGKFHSYNDLTVGDHHGYGSKVHLQVLR